MAHDAMSLVLVALLTILFTFSTSGFAFTDEPVEPETPTAIPEPESEPAEPLLAADLDEGRVTRVRGAARPLKEHVK